LPPSQREVRSQWRKRSNRSGQKADRAKTSPLAKGEKKKTPKEGNRKEKTVGIKIENCTPRGNVKYTPPGQAISSGEK